MNKTSKLSSQNTALSLLLLGLLLIVMVFAGRRVMGAGDISDSPSQTADLASQTQTPSPTAEPTLTATPTLDLQQEEKLPQTFRLPEITPPASSALAPRNIPLTYRGKPPQHDFQTYKVVRGDTPNGIADAFGIKGETILGGNPSLSEESNLLQTGDELIILPIDGVLHDVQAGDTLESISEEYGIDVEEIIAYEPNNLEFPYRVYPDSQILVPGAVRELFVWEPPVIVNSGGSYWAGQAAPIIVGTGFFQWPVGGGFISQTYWYGHPAIDVGVPTGTPLYAADSGTVTYAAWSPYCYGNLIVVNHGNGYETFYAHLSTISVFPGQIVLKGGFMGYTGNTGCSTGPHLHLEIRVNGYRDSPFYYLP